MSAEHSDWVTAEVVDALWVEAIERSSTVVGTHERVEALLRLVSAENPVVNRGMLDLHSLTRSGDPPLTDLVNARAYWLAELEGYDADPEAWMRRYFLSMLEHFKERHGLERTRTFAGKLVRDGSLLDVDLPSELRETE